MSLSIELISLSESGEVRTGWSRGAQRAAHPSPVGLATALAEPRADAVLCLDAAFALPDLAIVDRLLDGPADAWHAGVRLGLDGQPRLFEHVNPLWMLNCTVDPTTETTSWRLSLRALLVRASVLEQLGGPVSEMDTLSGAGLELGLRWIRAGALVRHVPDLAPADATCDPASTDSDGLQLIGRHHGRVWAGWALQRAVVTREIGFRQAARLTGVVRQTPAPQTGPYEPPERPAGETARTVSVIVPTIDRYAYLEPLLHQLAGQSVPPHQVMIADQTSPADRRHDLTSLEPALPVTVIDLPEPGQCTARNAALRASTGELVLFIDDDDEIGPDLIADHLRRLVDGVDASCGGVDDATAGPPPEGFRHRRASDVFPTNNTLIRRAALDRSGLFDLRYDRGPRADHDLGMRLHLSGALLVYDPSVLLFHHHASAGGLRTHGARRITRSSARRSLAARHLPSVTELYLGLRYFTPRQNREASAIRLLSLLSGEGSLGRRASRSLVQLTLLPSSARRMAALRDQAESLVNRGPRIPHLDSASAGSPGES